MSEGASDTAGPSVQRYLAREAEYVGARRVGNIRLKVYTLCAAGREVDEALLDSALAQCESVLLSARASPWGLKPVGVGFVIVHSGEDAVWVLVDWWVDGSILAQRLFRWDRESPNYVDLTAEGLANCLWEGGIIDFERRAYIDTMMSGRRNPSAYLVTGYSGPV